MRRSLLSAVLSLSVLLSPLVAAQDASYTFTRIDVPNAHVTELRDINTAGQIVGMSSTGGFLTDISGTTFTPIGGPGGINTGEVSGINDQGQIVGWFYDGRMYRGFLKDGDTYTTITVPGSTATYASGINNHGQIVGWFDDATGRHGFLKDGTMFTTIDGPGTTFDGRKYTWATKINDQGQIVGWFGNSTGYYGFLTSDGSTLTIIDVPGAQIQQAQDINTAGQIVGWFNPDYIRAHGFLTLDGTTFTIIDVPDDLSTPGTRSTGPLGINDEGQIVGWFSDGAGFTHGFLATPIPVDTTPPVIMVTASPETLWPPNGQLVPVTVSGTIIDEPDGSGVNPDSAAYTVIDEYSQIQPKGNVTLVDGQYAFTVALQASRRGNDQDGRQYTVEVRATDNAGNLGSASTTVTVPRN